MITVYYDVGDNPNLQPMLLTLHDKRQVFLIDNEFEVDYSAAIHDVYMVQADAEELAYIKEHFAGLRWVGSRTVVKWTGTDAEFIVNNISIVRQGKMRIR